MAKNHRISLRDLEQESEKFLAPATEKEKAILDAAVRLLGERGIDGTTTAEIARRAGVTERTLFRYFPSKSDLVKRVLFPHILRGGLERSWGSFETILKSGAPDLKQWYSAFTAQRLASIAQNPGLARTLLTEIIQNEPLKIAVGKLWRQHIWGPMIEGLTALQAGGAIRKEVDINVLARVIHSLNVGYFFARHVLAPDLDWDDARETEKMADILIHGAGNGGAATGEDVDEREALEGAPS